MYQKNSPLNINCIFKPQDDENGYRTDSETNNLASKLETMFEHESMQRFRVFVKIFLSQKVCINFLLVLIVCYFNRKVNFLA